MINKIDADSKTDHSKRGKRSRDKGKRGEREVAKIFQESGFHARRSVQYNGRPGTAADVVGIPGLHLEVKFVEKERIREWYRQAERDATASPDKDIPVIVHRKSWDPWLVTLSLGDFIKIIKQKGD